MKKGLISSIVIFMFISFAQADEGMWLPYLLKLLNEKDMQSKGLRISADDIYSINKSSLKDAVVLFGGGCTGEIVSEQGLLLTNHHCGYGRIQAHSSLENDYLANGFWATKKEEELPNPGFTVTLLISMSDVTEDVLQRVTENMTEKEREELIEKNSKSIIEKAIENTHYKAVIKPIYNGNQYLLFINEVFQDIRLVGAPPSGIGKFGGDTDNWMWPRHTGDFSVFRIYTGKDGKPAPFSKDNIPYIPKKHLSISLKGIEPEDFTFVFGYPGSTEQFLTSWAVELVQNQTNPIAINLRTQRLNIIKKYMENDRLTRIQYSAKAAGIANGWKKWIGENKGLQRLNTIENKKTLENHFTNWINEVPARKQLYGNILPKYEQLYKEIKHLSKENSYFMEGFYGIEIVRFAWTFNSLVEKANSKEQLVVVKENTNALIERINAFFKDYNPILDKEIFVVLMQTYYDNCDKSTLPDETKKLLKSFRYNMTALANDIYSKSIFLQQSKLSKIMEDGNIKAIASLKNDLLFRLINPMFHHYIDSISNELEQYEDEIKGLDRLWTKALMEMQSDKIFYPDANMTLRVTYGKIDGYNPRDGVSYKYYTTIDGIMEKENDDISDYTVDPKLKQLYANKDYGRYAMKNGEMPVAFVATNHTTGGNSGSPVLNGDGHLIGLNFDRCWEGTMSDIQYDAEQCRNISIDIRYCLFIIDKFAGAKHLIDEMTIIQ
ncbi:MAG: S46 family peptidase [Bacteroidales bacterium]|jgi:hypothetical protein|nr:S46 family peptidase [Bacteroidales bacterium]